MQFTLLTYDSTLALNAGYSGSANAVAFQETLSRLVETFSEYSGVEKKPSTGSKSPIPTGARICSCFTRGWAQTGRPEKTP